MKPMQLTMLNDLFNQNKYDILLNYLEGLAKIRNINAYFELLSVAIKKDNNLVINKMLSFKHMIIGKCSNINIFKEAVAYGSLELCQKLVTTKMVNLKYHHNILEYALSYKSFTHDMRKMPIKMEKIKWILTFSAVRKELKNNKIYKAILLRDHKELFIPIILPLIYNKIWFRKIIPTILSCCGMFNSVNLLKFLTSNNYIKIGNLELKQLLYSSIAPGETKMLNYCFSNYSQTYNIIQKIIENSNLINIYWTRNKYDLLKENNIQLFKNSTFYCSLVKLSQLHYQDQSNHYYHLLDLLDSVKIDLLEYPEVIQDIIENNKLLLQEHKVEFLKLLYYYNLQDKIPNKEGIAKRKKI